MHSVLDKYDLAPISSGVYMDEIVELQVRRRHNPSVKISDKEIEDIKQAIYNEYNRKFPLRIDVWTMPESPTLVG